MKFTHFSSMILSITILFSANRSFAMRVERLTLSNQSKKLVHFWSVNDCVAPTLNSYTDHQIPPSQTRFGFFSYKDLFIHTAQGQYRIERPFAMDVVDLYHMVLDEQGSSKVSSVLIQRLIAVIGRKNIHAVIKPDETVELTCQDAESKQ